MGRVTPPPPNLSRCTPIYLDRFTIKSSTEESFLSFLSRQEVGKSQLHSD